MIRLLSFTLVKLTREILVLYFIFHLILSERKSNIYQNTNRIFKTRILQPYNNFSTIANYFAGTTNFLRKICSINPTLHINLEKVSFLKLLEKYSSTIKLQLIHRVSSKYISQVIKILCFTPNIKKV